VPAPCPVLSRAAVADVIESALAGPPQQLCGVEAEWPVHRVGHLGVRPRPGDLAVVLGAPLPAGGRATVEPGGQLELSTAPAANADTALDAVCADDAELRRRLDGAGLAAVDLAVDTRRPPHRILEMPRYVAMEQFFAAGGDAGRWMMCNTASLQINISNDSQDTDVRWRQAHQLGPVLIAAFANTPGLDQAGRHWESLRQGIWWSVDPGRTRPPCPRRGMRQAWIEYALAADVMLIGDPAGGRAVPVPPGLPFARWLAEGHHAGYPTEDDLRYHLTTLFPPVRPRGWLELRMLDALPPRLREVAILVVTAALSPGVGAELARRLPPTEGLWCSAARYGLAHPVLAGAARTLFDVIRCHLDRASGIRSRRDAVHDYADRHVARALAPAQLAGNDALAARFAPGLGPGLALRRAV
jgi:glutamate--cysteine ligase